MFGVSPAFVVSMHGTGFTVDQFCDVMTVMKELGYDGYQPEVFHKDELMNWKNGGAVKVNTTGNDIGLIPTQFVAHFLMESFSSPDKLFSDYGIEELQVVLEIARTFPACKTVVVPVGPFALNHEETKSMEDGFYIRVKERLNEKMRNYLELISDAQLKFALELLPNSIVEGTDGFLRLCRELDSPMFGLSLDTGHAWACRELVPLLPLKLRNKILGLHICDNNSDVNRSLAPGRGTIDWKLFMHNLNLTGYRGSLDIEIICPPEEIRTEYAFGKKYLQEIIEA
jgi:sugar phosphate isomerase/epimerase